MSSLYFLTQSICDIYPELANECAKEPLPNGVLIEPALAPLLAKEPG